MDKIDKRMKKKEDLIANVIVAAEFVCILADDTGCSGDLTVTSKSNMNKLNKALTVYKKLIKLC